MANDWHAALLPVYLAAKYRPYGVYKAARSILAIHNLRHQVGVCTWTLSDGMLSNMNWTQNPWSHVFWSSCGTEDPQLWVAGRQQHCAPVLAWRPC